ncbi:Mss4-like protein [Cladochytrium replicatum]|nr:Mss4-like protein [Cladochytrium replicatum]
MGATSVPLAFRAQGTCLCGATRFSVHGSSDSDLYFSCYCHCTICQRFHSAPFTHLIGVNPEVFQLLTPRDLLISYKTSENLVRHRCGSCGTAVYSESLEPDSNFVDFPSAVLERDEKGKIKQLADLFKPQHHIFYGTRVADQDDGLAKFEGYSPRER